MRTPSTLRLPFWAATRFRLEQILVSFGAGPVVTAQGDAAAVMGWIGR